MCTGAGLATHNPTCPFLSQGLLERVKHNMESTCTAMDESNQLWMQQMMSQRTFATSFLEGYVPFSDGDETQTVAREFSEGSASRYDRYVRETRFVVSSPCCAPALERVTAR